MVSVDLFLPILASNDFSVIPRTNIDWNSLKLPIVNSSNTPGAYYYKKSLDDKTIVLEKNVNSIINTKMSPKEIYLVPSWGDSTYSKMLKGEIDLMPTVDPMRIDQIRDLVKNHGFQHKKTIPIKELSFNFVGEARRKYSKDAKFRIGKLLRSAILNNGKSLFGEYTPSFQFISPISEGALSKKQLNEITNIWNLINVDENYDPGFEVKILAYGIPEEDFKVIFGKFKWLKRIYQNAKITEDEIIEKPDLYFTASDSNFYESISFVCYNFAFEKLSVSKMTEQKWLEMYTTEKDKSIRLNLLQQIHFENLQEGNIVPVGHSYFSSLFRKDLNVPMYKEFAEMMLWKVTRK